MKKTFPLQEAGKAPARVVESVKHEIRKYVQREHRKALPEGFDLWTFACRVGDAPATAASCPLGEVGARIDQVVAGGGTEVYVEILATAAQRPPSSEAPAGR